MVQVEQTKRVAQVPTDTNRHNQWPAKGYTIKLYESLSNRFARLFVCLCVCAGPIFLSLPLFHSLCSTIFIWYAARARFSSFLLVVDAFSRFPFRFDFLFFASFSFNALLVFAHRCSLPLVGHEPDVFVCSNPTSVYLSLWLCVARCLCVFIPFKKIVDPHFVHSLDSFAASSFVVDTRSTQSASAAFSAHKWFIPFNL